MGFPPEEFAFIISHIGLLNLSNVNLPQSPLAIDSFLHALSSDATPRLSSIQFHATSDPGRFCRLLQHPRAHSRISVIECMAIDLARDETTLGPSLTLLREIASHARLKLLRLRFTLPPLALATLEYPDLRTLERLEVFFSAGHRSDRHDWTETLKIALDAALYRTPKLKELLITVEAREHWGLRYNSFTKLPPPQPLAVFRNGSYREHLPDLCLIWCQVTNTKHGTTIEEFCGYMAGMFAGVLDTGTMLAGPRIDQDSE
ncbi:hypothetical protein B0H19DRAFT_1270748 [Mycena capillaripes]|nr:hypothetical protein B0H19DRAFT_1270748 [Mycena capillaripes]